MPFDRNLYLDLRGSHGPEFIEFMRTKLGLDLNHELFSLSFLAIFARHIEQLEMREYFSYFSTHRL